ncbi:MAG: metallophosphoesterase [Myxococcota bacterium]|nr:metallophosphoesterase [Myxococcota bacterium]
MHPTMSLKASLTAILLGCLIACSTQGVPGKEASPTPTAAPTGPEQPGTEDPGKESPPPEAPGAEEPGEEEPTTEEPTEEQPTTEEPSEEQPATEEPSEEEPSHLPAPPTTATRTIQPVLPASWQSDSLKAQFGLVTHGPGEHHRIRNDLEIPPQPETPSAGSSIAYLPHLSDTQIVDEESPSRGFTLAIFSGTIYRRNEPFTPHIFHATLQTLNQMHEEHPFDFTVLTGDLIDNRQKNELDWFFEVIDGGWVHPDSGDDDDPIPGPLNDPHDPFFSEGLNTPWYSTFGNHDFRFVGNFSTSTLVGSPTRSFSAKAVIPTCLTFENESPFPARCGVPPLSYYSMGRITPDEQRASISVPDFVSKHLESRTQPAGHGFTQSNLDEQHGYWVADPIPGGPIRLIALDTLSPIGPEGYLSREQIDDFLIPELERAQDEGMIVLVLSHHPSLETLRGWELRELLHEHPNVVAHLVGHGHRHEITAHPGDTPEAGYWEIQTASLVDWPLQQRLIEVIDRGDGFGELWSTVFDFDTPPESMAAAGRFYCLFDQQDQTSLVVPGHGGERADRNVILRVAFPPAVSERLATLPPREPASPGFREVGGRAN